MTSMLRLLAIAGIAIAAVSVPHPLSAQTQPPVYLTQWGTLGAGDGQFDDPEGIATGGGELVYVVDFNNRRIQKFGTDGDFMSEWPLPHNYPVSVMPDGRGHVYVLYAGGFVSKCDEQGNPLLQWGIPGPTSAYGVAVDRDGNVYIADTGHAFIHKYDANGVFLKSWGGQGSGPGKLSQPYGLAVSVDGVVYVADTGNARVQRFDRDGQWLGSWGAGGSGQGQFRYPWSVATDGPLVYVVDSGNERIQCFTSTGGFLCQWGSLGSGNGQFSYVRGVAVDSQGSVFVLDTGNNRVQKFGSPVTPAFATSWGRVKRLYR